MGHRVEFDASQVKRALGIAKDKMETYSDMASFLAGKRFTQDSYIEYLNAVFPRTADKRVQGKALSVETLSRNAKLAHDVLETQPGAEYAEGSWWQAFNSVTFITDHVQGRNCRSSIMRDLYMMIVIVSMSGCTAVETSTQLYQLCKYQDKCPVEVVGNWLKGG
jgi:hypothetical protein